MKIRFLILCVMLSAVFLTLAAQSPDYGKMSSKVRRVAMENQRHAGRKALKGMTDHRCLIAFVKTAEGGGDVLADYDCEVLARWDNLSIARIPIRNLSALSRASRVLRIEAGEPCEAQLDTTAHIHHVIPLYEGASLPESYTGKGVVVGLEDIGFDLTNPTFYNTDGTQYRIRRLWDHLSEDSGGSLLPVGQEYTTGEAVLQYAHSRDGYTQSHGTHTAGIAAGSGGGTPYRGIAYESDICLVSNAVTSDTIYIEKEKRDLYTSAVDVLGFKYIFDYAQSVGKPCVVSFSEGSRQDFGDDSRLCYEAIRQMTGPGRIFVCSAGNESVAKSYFRKPPETLQMGTFLSSDKNRLHVDMLSSGKFTLCLHVYDGTEENIFLRPASEILADADSLIIDSVSVAGQQYVIYWNSFTPTGNYGDKLVYQLFVEGPDKIGHSQPVAFSVIGYDEVEVFRNQGDFVGNATLRPDLNAGEMSHNILVPGSAPDAITVGSVGYRERFTNYNETTFLISTGTDGQPSFYSSRGPTPEGLTKPDVVANGTIISAYSSFYYERNSASAWDLSYTEHNGRIYPWHVDCGTSMSTPVVAGIIALWLQANPRLAPDDVKRIIAETSIHPDADLTYPNNLYGYGIIDAEAGLRKALAATGIEGAGSTAGEGRKASPQAYNLMGQPVGIGYRGIVVRNGRKYTNK